MRKNKERLIETLADFATEMYEQGVTADMIDQYADRILEDVRRGIVTGEI